MSDTKTKAEVEETLTLADPQTVTVVLRANVSLLELGRPAEESEAEGKS